MANPVSEAIQYQGGYLGGLDDAMQEWGQIPCPNYNQNLSTNEVDTPQETRCR